MFHRIICLLFIVSSLSRNFNRSAVSFQSFSEHCLQEYSKCRPCQTLEDYTQIKALNKKYIINSLLCSSVTLLMFIQTLDHISGCKSENRLAVLVILEFFFSGLAKSPHMLRWSRILNECKIVKYCILLSEVSLIKTVSRVLIHLIRDV